LRRGFSFFPKEEEELFAQRFLLGPKEGEELFAQRFLSLCREKGGLSSPHASLSHTSGCV